MSDKDYLIKILEIEMNRVNHLDTILFNIKAWTATLIIVLIGFVFSNDSAAKNTLLSLAMGATVVFFLIDIYFRKIQLRNSQNTIEIRRYLKSIAETEVWNKLWAKQIPVNSKLKQNFIDYGYTIIVYGLLLSIQIVIWIAKH